MKKCLLFMALATSFFGGISYQTTVLAQEETESLSEVHEEVQSDEANDSEVDEAFAVLLLGVDTGDLGRTEQGRSDVMLVMTVNPEKQKITLTSIPRDAYVEIPGYYMDKINHAYAFGDVELSQETVEEWLDIEIDNYVVVNMSGLKEIVDAVEGIVVTPPNTFSIGQYQFSEGEPTYLDGEGALAYSRERYTSGGDYARQGRQREVIEAVMREAANPAVLQNLPQVLSAFSNNIETDLNLIEMLNLFTKYASDEYTVDTYQVTGVGTMIDGIYYDLITDESYLEAVELINDALAMP